VQHYDEYMSFSKKKETVAKCKIHDGVKSEKEMNVRCNTKNK
jgi:hypothetical protein